MIIKGKKQYRPMNGNYKSKHTMMDCRKLLVVSRSYLSKMTYCLLLWFLGKKGILSSKLYLLQYARGKTATLAVAKYSDTVKLVEVILNFFLFLI